MPASQPLSAALLAANAQLAALREQHQQQKRLVELSPSDKTTAVAMTMVARVARPVIGWPAHLGWGSEAITAVIRRHGQQESGGVEGCQDWTTQTKLTETAVDKPISANNTYLTSPNNSKATDWIKLYPDIGLGMLRQEMTAPGRLWLMLRYLDQQGSGKLRIDIIRKNLSTKTSALYMCGKRQLRNLLQSGEGVFWTKDKEHIWLFSVARVAYALDVERLTVQPVGLSVPALLAGIGSFRAHLYAAFHSGRSKETSRGTQATGKATMPIARDTLFELSGVGHSSQRAYETRAGVKVRANFAVGEVAKGENKENQAWVRGQALFELKDYRGEQGKKGKSYLAWQLPNTYIGQHQKRPLGRQKRINRKLKDLVMKGMPGNVGGTSETEMLLGKIYYPNGKLAAKAYGRDPERELYWSRHKTRNGRFILWQQLARNEC